MHSPTPLVLKAEFISAESPAPALSGLCCSSCPSPREVWDSCQRGRDCFWTGHHEAKGIHWRMGSEGTCSPKDRNVVLQFLLLKKGHGLKPLFAPSHCFLQIDCSRVEYCVFCLQHHKDEYLEQGRFKDGKAAGTAGSSWFNWRAAQCSPRADAGRDWEL